MSEALVVDGVHKSFGELEVLRGVDLAVAEHEVICLIGASGSGKSTLLRCVNLLEPIDQGRIVVEGEEITARGVNVNKVRRRIGIVFQAYNLFPHMSVLSNVTLAPTLAAAYGVIGDVTLPQRRTDAFAWAVTSILLGIGAGAALGGLLADISPTWAFTAGTVASLIALLTWLAMRPSEKTR